MKKLKAHKRLFSQNELGEYWQSYCLICLGDVFSYKVDDVHYIFGDSKLIGSPICTGCYNDLKDKIPNNIDLIRKQEIERAIVRSLYQSRQAIIKNNLEKWM